jgi:S-formylglutathione hydrolase FrmB
MLSVLLFAVGGPSSADAAQIVTWETESRFVDPANVQFNPPPPGAPDREPGLGVNVYLPDGYDGERRFPVLYLLHNLDATFDSWANPKHGDLMNVASGFPGIIVMPEGARGWYANWWNGGARGDPGWERYHLDELIPLVERRLRIMPGRRWHAIAGPSMGGQGAAFYASQRPGYFGAAALFSGALSIQRQEWPDLGMRSQGENPDAIFGDPSAQNFYWTGHNPLALIDNLAHTRLYVTVGDGTPTPTEIGNYDDLADDVIGEFYLRSHSDEFVAAAGAAGLDVTYEPRQGLHDWPDWRQHLAAAISWGLFEPVPEKPKTWTYETVAEHSDAWGICFDFLSGPPEELATFKREGSRISGTGAGLVRVTVPGAPSFTAELPFDRELPLEPSGAETDICAERIGACQFEQVGGRERDKLRGTSAGDSLRGRGGRDSLRGKGGEDCLAGGRGADRLNGGPDADDIAGGRGKDRIDARDRERDLIRCGPGADRVKADARDRLRGCERRR